MKTLYDRFWEKVSYGTPWECWPWQAATNNEGYGKIWYDGKLRLATHVSWMLRYGQLPSKHLCHTCDNPPCVNPDHLFEGTFQDNYNDMVAKGRKSIKLSTNKDGENNGRHKLTASQVLHIRELYEQGRYTSRELSQLFKVGRTTVYEILQRKRWVNV
jgi:hypothetical protein